MHMVQVQLGPRPAAGRDWASLGLIMTQSLIADSEGLARRGPSRTPVCLTVTV